MRAALPISLLVFWLGATASAPAAQEPAPAPAPRPLRLGIAGLTHGHVHGILQHAKDRTDVEIVGVWERDRALAERYLAQYGIPKERLFDDLGAMLESTKPGAVAAFGPTLDHLGVVQACAPRRVHVMVEKPLATSADDAREMAGLARKNGVQVLTNYETTWYPSNHRLFDMVVRQRTIGAIRKMVVHDGHPGPVAIGVQPEFLAWLRDPRRNGGGALMDFGCYGADLATWLMKGERPLSVTAVTQQLQPSVYPEVEDEATIVIAYPRAQAILQASWNWPFGRKDMQVYGEKGYVTALDSTNLRSRVVPSDGERRLEADPLPASVGDPFRYLAAVVRGEVEVKPDDLSSLDLNLTVMTILDAARQSARTGRTIRLGVDQAP